MARTTSTAVTPDEQLTNEALLGRYARAGCIGLVGADTAIDLAIRVAEKSLTVDGKRSLWSHAFLCEGERVDGKRWVVESDLDLSRGFFRFGVQENRVDKYYDEETYPNLLILDFGLSVEQTGKVLAAALEHVARGTPYALGGLLKTSMALARKQVWKQRQKDSTYCSSFVRAVYQDAGIDLTPGIALRHTAPEHLSRCELPHMRREVVRQPST